MIDDRPRARLEYALAAAAVFGVEVCIALFVNDRLVRPYVGDALAVVLVYLGLHSITPLGSLSAVTSALAVATAIEVGQALGLLDALGLRDNRLARTVLGGMFDWRDFLAYAAGAGLVLAAEAWRSARRERLAARGTSP